MYFIYEYRTKIPNFQIFKKENVAGDKKSQHNTIGICWETGYRWIFSATVMRGVATYALVRAYWASLTFLLTPSG